MISVALKMLVGDRLKYLGLVIGVAFATLLIVQQASILLGLSHQTGAFIRDTSHGDLWVMDDQVRFSQDVLPLPETTLSRIRSVPGVEWAVPMYEGFLKARLPDGTRKVVILIGLDDATLVGAPPEMVRGTLADLRKNRGVFIDADSSPTKLLMKRGGGRAIDLGDRFAINDNEVEVVGTYRGSKSFFWEPVMYTTYTRALSIAPKERKLLAFTIVKARPGQNIAELAGRIKETTGLSARTNHEFEAITAAYILNETGILVNFGMAVGLGFVIGILICGQMLYNFTLDNLRYYGTLKAMGAGNPTLVLMVLAQVITIGALGYGLGLGAGTLLGQIVGAGGLAFLMPWWVPILAAGAILVICVFAGLLSLSRVLKLEPAVVFK